MNKRLIEYDLPLAEISEASAREKNIRHGHPSTLHIWWARRPLASSRATAFAALIDDPGPDNPQEREELLGLLGPDVAQRYERVRAVTGTGTARIEGQSCVACHRQIPPETVNRVLAGEVHTCGCCQRLLVIGDQ